MENENNPWTLGSQMTTSNTGSQSCYDLKLELRLHLGKDLRKDKG